MTPAHSTTPADPHSTAVEDLITTLPKVELHVHLEGCMRPELLWDLARHQRLPGLPASLDAARRWYEFRDFPHFIDVFETAVRVLRDGDDLARLVEEAASDLAAAQVRYAEVTFSPLHHIRRGIPAAEVFAGLERGRRHARDQHGIELRWIADFPGHWGAEAGMATVEAVLAAGLDSVVGLTVGGIEVDRDPFADVFARARAAGLRSVPHAGEVEGPERIWSAIRVLRADRIGHGIRCLDDPALVDHLVETRVPLDVCPTSNLRTGAVASLAEHPLPAMLAAGLTVTLNSDDPPMFGTDLNQEYRTAHRMGLNPAALVELARGGVQASFAPEPIRAAILAEINQVTARLSTHR